MLFSKYSGIPGTDIESRVGVNFILIRTNTELFCYLIFVFNVNAVKVRVNDSPNRRNNNAEKQQDRA